MKQITIDNRLGDYPFILWSPDDNFMNKELLQFTCREGDSPISQINIDEKGVHYMDDEGFEVNNKGFYFFTEQDALDFIAEKCSTFNALQIHADDPIYYDGEIDTISSAYFDEAKQDIVIKTDSYKEFLFSELGKRFSLTNPAEDKDVKVVFALTKCDCQSRCSRLKNTIRVFESRNDAITELAKIKNSLEMNVTEETEISFKCKEREFTSYPYMEYRIEEICIVPEGGK